MTAATSSSSFFRLLDVPHADMAAHSDAIGRLRAGELTGIVVRNVLQRDEAAAIVSRLERHDPPFLKTWFPEKFRSWFYGQNLNLMHDNPAAYFAEVDRFHSQMNDLLPEPRGFNGLILRTLSQLDGNRPYRAAPGPEPGQSYMVTTFRGHGEGGHIPAHCDNEQALRPAYEHLQTIVSSHMYSLVLLLGAPDAGGELEVFDYRVEPSDARLMNDDSARAKPDLASLPSVRFALEPGDLIVVDSGRYLHRVTPVIGTTTRWTACSFMAHARERQAVYCWG